MQRLPQLAALALMLWSASAWAGDWTRNLACATQKTPDAAGICKLLETHMEFQWLGHGTLAPGYRVTFASIRKTWCARSFSPADVPVLLQMEQSADWRLQMGTSALRTLVEKTPQPASSVYNPENPDYILRLGCATH